MIDPATQAQLKHAIADCIGTDQGVLDALREEIRPLRKAMRRIQPRATTASVALRIGALSRLISSRAALARVVGASRRSAKPALPREVNVRPMLSYVPRPNR
jgi:hypothetical protein